MSDKDEIKELFQKELGNYQAKVNPDLWSGIQAGLGSATAAGTATSLGLIGKIVISVSIVAAVTVGTVLLVNKEDNSPKTENTLPGLIAEDTVSKESVIQLELKEIDSKNTNEKGINSNENDISKEEISNDNLENTLPKKSLSTAVPKEFSSNNENQYEVQNNKVIPQKLENKVEDKSNTIIKEKQLAPAIKPIVQKEEFLSELDDFSIQLFDQKNQYVSFTAEGVPDNAYIIWNFGDGSVKRALNPEHFYTDAGSYTVTCTVKTDNEELQKKIQIQIIILGEVGNLPNVFTPNGDGNNDEFFVTCKNIKNFQLTIIDNQQNIIFATNDPDFRWNGFDKFGQPAKEGTYYYIIVAEDESGNTINKYQQLRLQR